MGDFLKLGKAWIVAGIVSRVLVAIALVIMVSAVVSDGGRFSIEWVPGVQNERTE